MAPATAVASSVALVRGPEPKSIPIAATAGEGPLAAGDRLTGHYVCTQGRTDLTIAVEDVRGDDVFVVFEFAYDGRTPGHAAAAGSYRMHGRLDRRSGKLDLTADEWIDRPGGYVTVDLRGTLTTEGNTQTYKGAVKSSLGSGCSTFHVSRQAVLPSH